MFKKFTAELYDFFFRKVLNYLSLLFVFLFIFRIFFKNSNEVLSTSRVIFVIIEGMTILGIASIIFYFLYYFVNYGKVFLYLGNINYKISEVLDEIDKDKRSEKAFKESESCYQDVDTIKKLEEINNITAYEAFTSVNLNFGFYIIPIFILLGWNPIFVYTSLLSDFISKFFCVFCIFGLLYKYYYSFLINLVSTTVSENYNKVLFFYQDKLKENK